MSVYQIPPTPTTDRVTDWRARRAAAERLGADYPRPLTAVDDAAMREHLASLSTSAAPSAPRPAPSFWRRALGALLPSLLALLLIATPTAAAAPTEGMVMHANDDTFEILGAVVMSADTTTTARMAYALIDEDMIEEEFGAEVERELAVPVREIDRLGVDEMRGFAVEFEGFPGYVYLARDGRMVAMVLYFAMLSPERETIEDYLEDVLEDGIDARTPRGFEEVEREEEI